MDIDLSGPHSVFCHTRPVAQVSFTTPYVIQVIVCLGFIYADDNISSWLYWFCLYQDSLPYPMPTDGEIFLFSHDISHVYLLNSGKDEL